MSKSIEVGRGEAGQVLLDPKALVTTKMLVTANSGGGKSYLLRKVLEQVGQTAQTFVIDMEGEFVTLREKLDMVIVGPNGEIPADVRSAGLLVRRLMEKGISAVIDLSELRAQPRRQFVREFFDSLIGLPKTLWRPLFVCLDEAHQFAPEKGQGEAESLQSVRDLCTLGRKRGYCAILATQRISTLDKTCASECNNKFIGRMTLKNDIERAAFDLGVSSAEAMRMVRQLAPGEFYSFGPAMEPDVVTKMKVGTVQTTHPKAGQGHTLTPPKPSHAITAVVAELIDLPKQAEAEIKELATAKEKIAELQRRLAAKPAVAITQSPKVITVQPLAKPALPESENDMANDETNELLRQLLGKMGTAAPTPSPTPAVASEEESMYQRFKSRLLTELPTITAGVSITVTPPEKLRKDFQQAEAARILTAARDLKALSKRILKFTEGIGGYTSQREMAKRLGRSLGGGPMSDMSKAVKELASLGFVENNGKQGIGKSLRNQIAADLATYQPVDADIEAVYQQVLYSVATENIGD